MIIQNENVDSVVYSGDLLNICLCAQRVSTCAFHCYQAVIMHGNQSMGGWRNLSNSNSSSFQ